MNSLRPFSVMKPITRHFSLTAMPVQPHPLIPKIYMEEGNRLLRDTVLNFRDPRTIPRAFVLSTAAAFYGYMTYRKLKFGAVVAEDRNQVINTNVPPKATEVVQSVTGDRPPIAIYARKYQTLRKRGLGVDDEE